MEKWVPQYSSSEPSEQSRVKSHTWLRLTHSFVALHTNWPGGQLWGGVTDIVGTGAVVLGSSEGNWPTKCNSLWASCNVQKRVYAFTFMHMTVFKHIFYSSPVYKSSAHNCISPSYGSHPRKDRSSIAISPLKSSPTVPSTIIWSRKTFNITDIAPLKFWNCWDSHYIF